MVIVKSLLFYTFIGIAPCMTLEDELNDNEPPDWFFSVRHLLGAVLIKAGKYSDAEKTYNQDLQTWHNNGWALIGLYNTLLLQKKNAAATAVKFRFNRSWLYADVKIGSSSPL